ncbi:hypothetical protein AG1IA_03579 [Rhizoctonia solani AG-1 IA]|uniref:Uncharacterized protein n=3 Tax=Rhizoctonia solani TaxID=456999 RepID=A0A8H7HJM4_9AGAM|nr:hypothetical protein AG1IA_03579 [Rhizoctonia solani AG-1 IA]KAF8686407.1 hypothetical protein RHS04_00107 [Rhizoctonia solani]
MSTAAPMSSRSSSLPPSNAAGELKDSSAMTWTTATFSFPPCLSRPARAPAPLPRPRSKSRESQASSSLGTTTSRMIGNIPGFDDFAELVISSERAIPRVTVTPTSDHPSPRISRSLRTHPPRSKLSEPKSTTPVVPTETASLPWSKEDNDAGRVTFIFGRFRPSIVRRSAPPSTQTNQGNQVRSQDFVNLPSPRE